MRIIFIMRMGNCRGVLHTPVCLVSFSGVCNTHVSTENHQQSQATARIFRVVIGYLFLLPTSISNLPIAVPKENVTFAAVFQNPVVRDIIY